MNRQSVGGLMVNHVSFSSFKLAYDWTRKTLVAICLLSYFFSLFYDESKQTI